MSKGIILAGGKATRLFPVTEFISKQVLPIYDKPAIYYPLATLMEAGVRDILLITNPEHVRLYSQMLTLAASCWGVRLRVVQQDQPRGIAQAITIAADHAFIDDKRFLLILGDNLFHGSDLSRQAAAALQAEPGADVFLARVRDPRRYGVASFDDYNNVNRIVEKPVEPDSSWAVTGLYCYDASAVELVRQQKPSNRDELEITDLNNTYCQRKALRARQLDCGTAWLDTGTADSLLEAGQYVQAIQHRALNLVGSPDLAALRNGWASPAVLRRRFAGREDAYAMQLRAMID